jgi:hypothetical protein
MSAVFHWLEFEAEGQSACSKSGLPPMGQFSVVEIDGLSAKVMARTGETRELVVPDRARLLNPTRAAEGIEGDRHRLRGITSPEGVDMTGLHVDMITLSACE